MCIYIYIVSSLPWYHNNTEVFDNTEFRFFNKANILYVATQHAHTCHCCDKFKLCIAKTIHYLRSLLDYLLTRLVFLCSFSE